MDHLFAILASADHSAPATGGGLLTAQGLGALLTLTLMEIVLGIDNVVFVAIQVDKLPPEKRKLGRTIGMGLALVMRLGLLASISWIMGLKENLFMLPGSLSGLTPSGGFSGRDLILLGGGLFLLYKASTEIYEKLEGDPEGHGAEGGRRHASFGSIIFQLIILDLVFSLDSVITAVGMANDLTVMVIAMFIAVGVMIAAASSIGDFVTKHPSVKLLALSFLNLIGVMLLLEGMQQHVNKGYIYSAMAFSLLVELLNMRYRKKKPPVKLHEPALEETSLKS